MNYFIAITGKFDSKTSGHYKFMGINASNHHILRFIDMISSLGAIALFTLCCCRPFRKTAFFLSIVNIVNNYEELL